MRFLNCIIDCIISYQRFDPSIIRTKTLEWISHKKYHVPSYFYDWKNGIHDSLFTSALLLVPLLVITFSTASTIDLIQHTIEWTSVFSTHTDVIYMNVFFVLLSIELYNNKSITDSIHYVYNIISDDISTECRQLFNHCSNDTDYYINIHTFISIISECFIRT